MLCHQVACNKMQELLKLKKNQTNRYGSFVNYLDLGNILYGPAKLTHVLTTISMHIFSLFLFKGLLRFLHKSLFCLSSYFSRMSFGSIN